MTRLNFFKATTATFSELIKLKEKSLREKYSNKKLNKHHYKPIHSYELLLIQIIFMLKRLLRHNILIISII